jgi:hypothetical protein
VIAVLRLRGLLRFGGISFAASLAALAFFGIFLGLLWSFIAEIIPGGEAGASAYKLAAFLLAAAAAFVLGGFITGILNKNSVFLSGSLFGLLLGCTSLGYAAPDFRTFLAGLPACVLLGLTGSWLSSMVSRQQE